MNANNLTPAQIAHILDVGAGVAAIVESVTLVAIKLAHSGVDIPGFEATTTAPRRKWASSAGAITAMVEAGIPDADVYAPQELISPAQAEKAIRKLGKWPKGKAAEDFAGNPLAAAITYTETSPTISKLVVDTNKK